MIRSRPIGSLQRLRRIVASAVIVCAFGGAPCVQAQVLSANSFTNTVTVGSATYAWMYLNVTYTGSLVNIENLNYVITSSPKYNVLQFPGLPTYSCYALYQATNQYTGIDSFSWQVNDGIHTSAVATCYLSILPNVVTSQPFTNTAPSGILTAINAASYISGLNASCVIQSQPVSGGIAYASGTTIYFQSAPGFLGTDTFQWAATDGITTSATTQATVLVSPSIPQPVAQTVVVASNTTSSIVPAYYGGGGYTCWAVKVSGPSHGTLNTNGWLYTPSTNYVGSDSFVWDVAYSNATTASTNTSIVTNSIVVKACATNADWTQWRFDECRTAQTPMNLPSTLYLQWRRDLPTCPSTFAGEFQTFSSALAVVGVDNCRPVQLGKQLFVSLMANDSVTAYNTDTGVQQWRYYASGALRRPPLAMALGGATNVVIFGSDDGFVYCLNAADGSERWRFQAAPNMKRAIGYGRLGSLWPVWSSPVAYSNKIYFAAGHLPSWGTFVYCLDAASGTVVWCNDGRLRTMDNANACLGPLSFSAGHTQIYGTVLGLNNTWIISSATGELQSYYGSRGLTRTINDYWYVDGNRVPGNTEPMSLLACTQTVTTATVATLPGFSGTVGSLLAGDNKLFVATTNGSIFCYGGSNGTARIYTNTVTPLAVTNDVWTSVVHSMLSGRPDLAQGLALVWGVGSGRLVTELAQQATNLMIVAVDPDTNKLYNLRVAVDAAGLSGARVSTMRGNPMDCGFAPYQAALIASEDVNVAGYPSAGAGQGSAGVALVQMLYKCTRPFGGEIWLPTLNAQDTAINNWLAAASLPTCNGGISYQTYHPTFSGLSVDGITRIKRTGFPESQQQVKPPFRPIVFGVTDANTYSPVSTINPAPPFTNGWNRPADPGVPNPQRGVKGGYDLYSWLPVTTNDPTSYEPTPPVAANVGITATWMSGGAYSNMFNVLLNPLYGRPEPIPDNIMITSGGACAGTDQYGSLFVRPSKPGSIANLSAHQYWGEMYLPEIGGCDGSGARCFAWDGMLVEAACASYCACCPDLEYTQIGLVSDDDASAEVWVKYQEARSKHPIQEKTVQQVGINFGAPMDRYDATSQLLWTHHPISGYGQMGLFTKLEPSPLIPVSYRGNVSTVYHSSTPLSATNSARGWLSPSQVTGMTGLTISVAQPLIARQGTPTLPLIGALTDSCWTSQPNRINLSFPGISGQTNTCLDYGYAMLRYDATNLYVAGGLYLGDSASMFLAARNHYMSVGLSSRDQQAPPVTLFYNIATGVTNKQSLGMSTNAWQVAAWMPASQFQLGDIFQAEFSIPWASLTAAGLWTNQLVMNFNVMEACLDGGTRYYLGTSGGLGTFGCYSPLYLDTARGPVTNSQSHTVQLYFTEMEGKTNGQRVFDVKLQGNTVLSSFDVAAAAGGPKIEVVKTFTNVIFADHLDVDFVPHAGAPILNSVSIVIPNATVAPNQPPKALLNLSTTNGTAPLLVTMNAQNSYDPDGQIIECAWDTGDGRLARGSLINHVFAEPGTYTVNLLVMDNRGATAVTSAAVTVSAGVPAAFICNIRSNGASGCDYTNLAAWSTALASDLTSSTTVFKVSSTGNWVAADNGKVVTFSGGNTGILYWVGNPLSTQWVAAVLNVGGTGTVNAGVITIAGGHVLTNLDAGSIAQSLLFGVSSFGTYIATNDDNKAVTFPGGGWGTLKHINSSTVAYIVNVCGAPIQTGAVTCVSSTHTFAINTTGNPIVTAVAQGYNDWTNGLAGATTLTNWYTDANHCLSIRPAAGQGHNGAPKNANGSYTGFALKGALTTTLMPYTRISGIICDGAVITMGSGCSVNRVLGSVTASGGSVLIANSIGNMLSSGGQTNVSLYNCTAGTFQLGSSFANHVLAVNCLSYSNTMGFSSSDVTGEFWLSHNVSIDNTATNYDAWQDGNEGNLAGRSVTFVNAAACDYRLASGDTGARGVGQPSLGADIAGNLRVGPLFDAGASQITNAPSAFQQWQLQYYGSTIDPNAASNAVNNAGISNYQMFLAGSNPGDSNTWFRCTSLAADIGNQWAMVFNTVSGKSYTVRWRTNLLDGVGWVPFTNFIGLGGAANVVFTNNFPQTFFQIQAQ